MVGRQLVTLRDTMMACYTGQTKGDAKNVTYARGIVVGYVGAIMALESKDFSTAIQFLKGCVLESYYYCPAAGRFDTSVLPPEWVVDWNRWSYATK